MLVSQSLTYCGIAFKKIDSLLKVAFMGDRPLEQQQNALLLRMFIVLSSTHDKKDKSFLCKASRIIMRHIQKESNALSSKFGTSHANGTRHWITRARIENVTNCVCEKVV